MNNLVSIITPSHNTGRFIGETIESVLAQTYTDWEMIIVDDCSDDNTDSVVASYSDPRIRYMKNTKNSGAAVTRNKALAATRGRWIAFLDSDDVWYPDKLRRQIDFMRKNGYYFSYSKYGKMDENSRPSGLVSAGPAVITKRGMYDYCWPGCLTVMYDSEKIGRIQIADIPKNNDYAIWINAIKKADCYLLPEVLALYRVRKGSISSSGYMNLIKHHYILWHTAFGKGRFSAIMLTLRNVFFGVIKKLLYVRKKAL